MWRYLGGQNTTPMTLSRHRVPPDQPLIAGMQEEDAVEHHGGVAVVGELLIAKCLSVAAGHAIRTAWDPPVHAAAKRAVSTATAATATARERTPALQPSPAPPTDSPESSVSPCPKSRTSIRF